MALGRSCLFAKTRRTALRISSSWSIFESSSLAVLDAVPVVAVDHVDETIGPLVVVAPERPDLVLAAHVPDCEAQVLVFNRLDVESYGRNRGHHLAKLELVQDGCFAGRVEANHQDAHLLFPDEALPDLRECEPHGQFFLLFSALGGGVKQGLSLVFGPSWS
eukprot:CAMPEP_0168373432 /NCGR_PEP_ID=MMETSP0228-20121227/8786_1 /TAXON_ID=133427 /ORGANISM="Protoceratium reticulatum, Strain CCCM 535 (=CCMP 1889)" /LENGTH=161 /DNA_ID=CAMNT_0008386355 /DNA_START=203 /DNA_END=683 /DNA_ORIENTATION=+